MHDKTLNVFRLLRIARDLRVKDVAEKLNIRTAYVHAIEKGDRYPSDRLLRDYADVLDVNVETIKTFQPEKYTCFEKALLSLLKTICWMEEDNFPIK